jgi:hypothetical protein
MNKKFRNYNIEIDNTDTKTKKILDLALERLNFKDVEITHIDLENSKEYTIKRLLCKQIDKLSREMSKIEKEKIIK